MFLDSAYPLNKQFPRVFEISIEEHEILDRKLARIYYRDQQLGNDLTDQNYQDDGYRFHDIFHLGLVASLGWSPVIRNFMNLNRDSAEDGIHFRKIEEIISILVFATNDPITFKPTPENILDFIIDFVKNTEARIFTKQDWQEAILKGYETWRQVHKNGGGKIKVDMFKKEIKYLEQK